MTTKRLLRAASTKSTVRILEERTMCSHYYNTLCATLLSAGVWTVECGVWVAWEVMATATTEHGT